MVVIQSLLEWHSVQTKRLTFATIEDPNLQSNYHSLTNTFQFLGTMTNTYNVTEGTKVDNLHERDNIELTLNVPFPCEEEYTNSGFVCDDPKLKVQSEVII